MEKVCNFFMGLIGGLWWFVVDDDDMIDDIATHNMSAYITQNCLRFFPSFPSTYND